MRRRIMILVGISLHNLHAIREEKLAIIHRVSSLDKFLCRSRRYFIYSFMKRRRSSIDITGFFFLKKGRKNWNAIQFLVFFNLRPKIRRMNFYSYTFPMKFYNILCIREVHCDHDLYKIKILLFRVLYLITEIRIFLLSYPLNSKLVLVRRNKNGFVGSIDEKSFHFHEKFSWAN